MKQMTRLYFVIDDDIKKICGSRSAVIDTGHRYNGRVKFDFNDKYYCTYTKNDSARRRSDRQY